MNRKMGLVLMLVLLGLAVSAGVFGFGEGGEQEWAAAVENVSGLGIEEIEGGLELTAYKNIDEVWLRVGAILGIDEAEERKIYTPHDQEWVSFDVVYGAGEVINGFVSISNMNNVICKAGRCLLTLEAKEALSRAAAKAKTKGYTLWITSALRTLEEQKSLWIKNGGVGTCPIGASNPTNEQFGRCPHVSGTSVDVTLAKNGLPLSQGQIGCMGALCGNSGSYDSNNEYQKALKDIMSEWSPWSKEWWHYEYRK